MVELIIFLNKKLVYYVKNRVFEQKYKSKTREELLLDLLSKCRTLSGFSSISDFKEFIPPRAKRVGESIEIRHKKFHPPIY